MPCRCGAGERTRQPTRPLFQAAARQAVAGGIDADSPAPLRVGERVFPIVEQYVEQVVLVPDRAIRLAQETLWATLRIVVEPGGAAAFAALLSGGYRPRPDERIGVLLSGGNTTAVNFDH